MRNLIRRNTVAGFVAAATLATMVVGLEAQGVKIADPTSVVMSSLKTRLYAVVQQRLIRIPR